LNDGLIHQKPPVEVLRLIADFSASENLGIHRLNQWEPLDEVFGQGVSVSSFVSCLPVIQLRCVYTVTAYEPGVRAVLTGIADKATAIDTIEVRSTDQGTTIDLRFAEIRLAFPYNWIDPILAIGFKKTVDHAVDGLRRFLSA